MFSSLLLTDPSQESQSFDGNGTLRSMVAGRWTSFALFSAMASVIASVVAFSLRRKFLT